MNAGHSVNGYRFEERLGSGGFTETWRASDASRSPCEIRLLTEPGLADAFLACGTAQQHVVHPNRLQVLDVATIDGVPAIVTEVVVGPTLAAWMRMRTRSLDEILPVFEDVARAVAAIHHAGMGHLVLDPAAVWMHTRRHTFVPKLDLAWGPLLAAAPRLLAGRSAAHALAAKVAGHAPQGFDPEVDQFLLGALLFEMISGQPPFRTEDLALPQLPKPPRLRHPHEQVPASLANLVERMLARNPADRPESVDDVLAELAPADDFMAAFTNAAGPTLTPATAVPVENRTEDSEPSPPAPEPPPLRWWRHPIAVASVVAAILVSVGGLVWLGT